MRTVLFLTFAAFAAAQRIPGRYIVQLKTEPAAAITAAKRIHYTASDPDVQARLVQLQAEHQALEAKIQVLGGKVTHHYTTLVNAMAVTLTDQAAATVRQMPEVKSVTPVQRHHMLMDQAVNLHRISQAWQTLPGGQAGAGAGIKIGILDCGVDNTHPAFSSFATPMPTGFPIFTGGLASASNVNNKVIVARIYSDVNGGIDNTTTDGNDYCQHGTTVAGVAAADLTNPNFSGISPLSGVAPGAWIGNYKVAEDTQGASDDVTFLAGLEDAVSDGMNVINYSSGSLMYAPSDENGPDASAVAQAVANGIVFVAAAGNEGPYGDGYFGAGLGSISSPAGVPGAIAVGAIENQRFFWYGATVSGTSHYAIPSAEELQALVYVYGDTVGTMVDVATLTSDTGGYACSALPANSLTNAIALIQRGSPTSVSCTFETKLNNAQNAGAIGAIIYDNTNRSYFDYSLSGVDVMWYQLGYADSPTDSSGNDLLVEWSMGNATLPSVMVSQADGQALKLVAGGSSDLDFDGKTPLSYPSNVLTDFSSLGPTPLGNLKPDVVAVGDWLVAPSTTTFETMNIFGDDGCADIGSPDNCYPPYTFLDSSFDFYYFYTGYYGQLYDDGAGTSFASPMVAGSAAVLMAAIPGLSSTQYRSLLTNGAAELDLYPNNNLAFPQYAGAGKLDLLGSLQAALTAVPATLNFVPVSVSTGGSSSFVGAKDTAAASAGVSQTVSITNVGAAADTFSVLVNSIDGVATPTVSSTSFQLAAGASKTVTVSLPGASSLAAGQYHGFIVISGTQGQTPLRLPYWYGVAGSAANALGLYSPSVDPPSCTDYVDFRLLDASGMPVTSSATPTVTTASPLASVVSVYPVSDYYGDYFPSDYIPGTFEAQISTGRPDINGNNVFTISSGSFSYPVTFSIDTSGATQCTFSSTSATTGTNARRPVSKLAGKKLVAGKTSGKKRAHIDVQ